MLKGSQPFEFLIAYYKSAASPSNAYFLSLIVWCLLQRYLRTLWVGGVSEVQLFKRRDVVMVVSSNATFGLFSSVNFASRALMKAI